MFSVLPNLAQQVVCFAGQFHTAALQWPCTAMIFLTKSVIDTLGWFSRTKQG
jgi:hypothetical protein